MKISLITPTYNSAKTIRDTLDSVSRQIGVDLEYIIVDNISSDKTIDIIQEYQDKLSLTIISEPDKGIYDAMNKGIKRANGDIIGILNSDDSYKNKNILKKITEIFINKPNVDIVYGDLEFIDYRDTKKITRFWKTGEYKPKKLKNGWTIPHPSMFVRQKVYQKYGTFNTNFRLAGDYELILRFLKKYKLTVFYYPKTLVSMRTGGQSGKSFKNRRFGWQELKLAWTINEFRVPPFFIFRRLLFKLKQYLVYITLLP